MLKLTAKQKYWSEKLLKADAFEGSLGQYAQTQNIPVQALYYWRSYLKRSSATEPKTKPAFTQVVSAPVTDCCVRLQIGVNVWPSTSKNSNLVPASSVFFTKGKRNAQTHSKAKILV
jgi:hypothetical protein